MKLEQINEIQKSLAYAIYETELGYYQFSLIKWALDTRLFWKYKNLIEYAIKSEDFQNNAKRSTDIVKEWLTEHYMEIIMTPFTFTDVFSDYSLLLKNHYMSFREDIFEKMVELQEKLDFMEKQKSFYSSKNYLIRELFDSCINELSEFKKRKQDWKTLWYSYGFPLLDKYTDWIQKGTLTRLNAYSNVGKSKFSYHVTNQLLQQGAHVIYFSLEVQKKRVVYNMIANKYNKTMYDVYNMEFDDIDFWELFLKKLEIVDDKYTLDEIIWYTEARNPDAIIIDFVQNIQHRGESEYSQLTDIAKKLQQLAIRKNIAIFDLSQVSNSGTNYASWDAIPSKWSGALVASADVWLMLKKDKTIDNRIVLHVAKNKFWQNGKSIDYNADMSCWTFKEVWESQSNAF